jgi:hypothetical protein
MAAVFGMQNQIVFRMMYADRVRVLNSRGETVSVSDSIPGLSGPLAVSPDGTRFAVQAGDRIEIFHLPSADRLLTIPALSKVPLGFLQFSSDGWQLIEAEDRRIRVLESKTEHNPDVRLRVKQALDIGVPTRPASSARAPSLVEETIARVRDDAELDAATRAAVIDELRRIGDREVVNLCEFGRRVVYRQGASESEYRRALQSAERASTLAPWSSHCMGSVGMAKYRTGDNAGALKAFELAQTLKPEAESDQLIFKAMALHGMGRVRDAAGVAAEVRPKIAVLGVAYAELKALFGELESMLSTSTPGARSPR